MDDKLVAEHRARALTPERPVLRGTAQNPDVFFQAREACNPFYDRCPDIVQEVMDKFAGVVGRKYRLFDYEGSPDAERVVVLMASGCDTAHETVDFLANQGEKVGVLKVRLYRPFDIRRFAEALPATVKSIAVLDRTKEPGSAGEPLYLDVVNAVREATVRGWAKWQSEPRVIGGRYGLSSKEFTAAMVKGVLDHLKEPELKNPFTIGINDDVTHTSLPYDPDFSTESMDVFRGVFFGLGSDGTVGANRNSIKIIGDNTDNYAQAYFVYDSKKAGAVTVSHLRFGPKEIRSHYLVDKANFVACHQQVFLERYDMLKHLAPGGIFLLNTLYGPNEVWDKLPRTVQEQLVRKKARFYVIDAYKVAEEVGLRGRINMPMQVCFFAISEILPREKAIGAIKDAIRKTFGKKGEEVVQMNIRAVDGTLERLYEVKVPEVATGSVEMPPPVSTEAPAFVQDVLGAMLVGRGDDLPVSALPADGTFPTATARWEKRNLALEIPVWDPEVCIQCCKCSISCPHAVIRAKVYDPKHLEGAPKTFKSTDARDKDWAGKKFTIQIAPEDCTGCGTCIQVCPAKNKAEPRLKAINMHAQPPIREQERENWEFFLSIPDTDRRTINVSRVRQQQTQRPLFEFSGACAGCGETPYVKLITQLFGDRMVISNATGCSSIYGGNLPTTPYTVNAEGRGPAWCNSLFEDNAEFGFGFRLSIDKQREFAAELLKKLSGQLGDPLVQGLLTADQTTEAGIYEQRQRVAALKERAKGIDSPLARQLEGVADMLVRRSVWILGGDGWAYDIGYGGLDHVLASGRDVNVLVLDTEVYSNTGGQMSKSTPRAAVAKFAAGGKPAPKKDLGLMAMTYGNVYVASVAMGARDEHVLRAFLEAESYTGPSLIIAYSHCISHGINMTTAFEEHKAAVDSGAWILYRFDPRRAEKGENPLVLDSKEPKMPIEEYMYRQNRFKMLTMGKPEEAKRLLEQAKRDVKIRWQTYVSMAARDYSGVAGGNGGGGR
jgi:pyruvate-ferredoxin/flavodoxin oxidoreductase